jgi:hypothetical protein
MLIQVEPGKIIGGTRLTQGLSNRHSLTYRY